MARKTIRQGVGSKAKPDADVKFLQSFLGTAADGVFGPNTTALTKAYQKRNGLKDDGVVGPATWALIEKKPSIPTSTPITTSINIPVAIQPVKSRKVIKQGVGSKAKPDADVAYWQNVLGIKADGIFGSGTTSATKVYQTRYNLKADGIVGPATWATIGKVPPRPAPVVLNIPPAVSTTSTAKPPAPKTAPAPVSINVPSALSAPQTATQAVTATAKKVGDSAKKAAGKVSDAAKKVTPEPVKKAADAVATATKKLPLWQKIAAGASVAVLGAYGVQQYRTRNKTRRVA